MNKLFQLINIPQDKANHIIWGAVTFAALCHFDVLTAGVAVLMQASLKEGYDALHPDKHTVDVWDAVATIAGGLLAWTITL